MCKNNGNQKWADYIKLEIDQQHQHDTYKDMGTVQAPKDYKKTRDHFVFDMKHDGRHNARLVADCQITDVPISSVYSCVVSLRGIILVFFITELNDLDSWG